MFAEIETAGKFDTATAFRQQNGFLKLVLRYDLMISTFDSQSTPAHVNKRKNVNKRTTKKTELQEMYTNP